ncbi:cyclase family protein [Nocardioides sp. S5]|uniref:cyclase family protein n=1 Tax=Nocardioides sp. S5 TaxID=2017486 RepID=UPI001A8F4728|nr:cyclase family protein [Nocardioides sp. S5]
MADSFLITGTQVGTHMDALGHIWDQGQMYNGFSRSEVRSTSGARRLGIENVKGIVTRGIFIDIPRDLGRDHLEPGFQITDDMLAQSLERDGLTLQPGDAVLIRTGFLKDFREGVADVHGWPGLSVSGGRFLARYDVAVILSDNLAIEAVPWDTSIERKVAPVHLELIRDHGIYFVEAADLEEVAACGEREVLFMAAPLPIKGGTGSPTNPLVVI